jgi:hypothetical protein
MDADNIAVVNEVMEEINREVENLLTWLAENGQRPLAESEQRVRGVFLRLQARTLETGLRMSGTGYEGSHRPCTCGGWQKYEGNRTRRVVTHCGEISVCRAYYRCSQCGSSVMRLDAERGIERSQFSPLLQKSMCRLAACMSFSESAVTLKELTGITASARSVENLSEAAGEEINAKERAMARQSFERPEAAANPPERLYVTCDGTTVCMGKEWKEVKVGAVYRTEGFGEDMRAVDTKYVALFEKAERFGKCWWANANQEGVMKCREVIAIADGASWIWNLVAEHFPAAIQIIDWYHAKEKLCEVGKAVYGESNRKSAEWSDQVADCLWEGNVEAVLKRIAQLRPSRKEARETVRLALGYFDTHRERMRYQKFRARGYQIGSGVVEGACNHLIGLREKQAGMRWKKRGAQAIASLRASLLSGRWDSYWDSRCLKAA